MGFAGLGKSSFLLGRHRVDGFRALAEDGSTMGRKPSLRSSTSTPPPPRLFFLLACAVRAVCSDLLVTSTAVPTKTARESGPVCVLETSGGGVCLMPAARPSPWRWTNSGETFGDTDVRAWANDKLWDIASALS